MTDFKAGDKIRYKSATDDEPGTTQRVIDYVGERFVVYTLTKENGDQKEFSYSLENLQVRMELVPEVFEKGKRYAAGSPRDSRPDFTVLYADDEVAFGKYHGPANTYTYVTHGSRHKYLEV